ncbi:MAG: J domain-containing protein [Cytophagales bacterium]|jgi:hypothetical protein|nr:J domain-containing protein [Cytophagales bacterium]
MKDYYQILRVSPEADATEIKKSYRQLANEFHPDKNNNPTSLAIFQEINEAYEVLGNRQQRQLYDFRRTYPDYVPPAPNPAPQPRRPPAAYRAQRRVYLDLRPYVTYTRIMCKVSLAFCVLLMLDYVLPRQTEEEPIVEIRIYKRQNRMVVFTPHHHYTIEEAGGFVVNLDEYTPVKLEYTPLFATVMRVRLRELTSYPSNIYGPLAFFPGLLLVLSVLGVWSRGSADSVVNFGIASTIMLLITLFLVFVLY